MKMLSNELAIKEGQTGDASKDMLAIVAAQRDRLIERVEVLERKASVHAENYKVLQNELEKTRGDNVKLYGKIKFLQSYQAQCKRQVK